MNDKTVVMVTGASGFIGSHIVREFLERGYSVRATVRDANNKTKTNHLLKLPGAEQLKLFSADVLVPDSFDEAMQDCDWVCHAAAAVMLTAKNPQQDIVDPAVNGTQNLLDSIQKNGKIKRLAMISSVAAIMSTGPREGYEYTEDDWNDDATLAENPYGLAKTQSEKLAKDFCASTEAPDLTVINPAFVLGPLLSRLHVSTSTSVMRDLYNNAFKGCPQLGFAIVDVRDVACSTVDALEKEKTGRFILYSESKYMIDLAKIIKENYPESPATTRKIPNFVMYVVALFDKRMSWAYLKRNLSVLPLFSNERLRKILNLKPLSASDAVKGTIDSMKELHVIKR